MEAMSCVEALQQLRKVSTDLTVSNDQAIDALSIKVKIVNIGAHPMC